MLIKRALIGAVGIVATACHALFTSPVILDQNTKAAWQTTSALYLLIFASTCIFMMMINENDKDDEDDEDKD